MIIKAGMVEHQFNNLVSKIDAKHETIGIKDKGLAERLTKLYDNIYCDANKRISHFERNWESKMKTSTIRDIGNIYHLIDQYNNTFGMFYEPIYSPSTIFISNGENDAARFIRTFYGSKCLDALRMEIFELLYTYESPPDRHQIDDLKTEMLKLL